MNNAKSYLVSKKFYFNALTVLFTIATSFGYVPNQQVANQADSILLIVAPIVNLILTLFFTKQPIALATPSTLQGD